MCVCLKEKYAPSGSAHFTDSQRRENAFEVERIIHVPLPRALHLPAVEDSTERFCTLSRPLKYSTRKSLRLSERCQYMRCTLLRCTPLLSVLDVYEYSAVGMRMRMRFDSATRRCRHHLSFECTRTTINERTRAIYSVLRAHRSIHIHIHIRRIRTHSAFGGSFGREMG